MAKTKYYKLRVAKAMHNHQNFIAVALDGQDADGEHLSARDVISVRLSKNTWPVYSRSKNKRNLSVGSNLMFYVGGAGPDAGHIVASARVSDIKTPNRRSDADLLAANVVNFILKLDCVKYFAPIRLKPILIENKIIKAENSKWGAYLMGGFVKIDDKLMHRIKK